MVQQKKMLRISQNVIIDNMSQKIAPKQQKEELENSQEPKIVLHLLYPLYKHKKITPYDLFCLKKANPSILDIRPLSPSNSQIKHVAIRFESMSDIADFQSQNNEYLSYANAVVNEQVVDCEELENCQHLHFPNQFEKQVQEEGFCIQNGKLKLKRQTSLEDELSAKEEELEDVSTLVHSEFFINFPPENQESKLLLWQKKSKQEMQVEGKQNEKNEQMKVKGLQLKQLIKPIFHTVILTGFIIGTTKIIKNCFQK